MSGRRPIHWHEGLFLRPQHFQQQDLYHEDRGYTLATATAPHLWGVAKLTLSDAALRSQVLEIEEFEALFPDGAWVCAPGNARLASRSFEGLWDEEGHSLAAFVGLKQLAGRGGNLGDEETARDQRGARFRLATTGEETADLYATGSREPVAFLDYELRIFFGEEAAQAVDYQTVKVCELKRVGGEVQRVQEWIPPLLHLAASDYLLHQLRQLREQLAARGRDLAQYKAGRGVSATAVGARDLLYAAGLVTVNRWIPAIGHLLEAPRVSPWTVYGMLRQLVGELSSYSERFDVFGAPSGQGGNGGLPSYRHDEPGAAFGVALRTATRLLEELAAGPDYVADLQFDGTYFYADLSERVFQGSNAYYLCVATAQEEGEIVTTLQSLAKIASKEYLPILIARALPGLRVVHEPSPPSDLPRRAGSVYFTLDTQGPAWDAIRDGLNVAVYFESLPPEVEIQLMVLYDQ